MLVNFLDKKKALGKFGIEPIIWGFFLDKKKFEAKLGLNQKFRVFLPKKKVQVKIGIEPKVLGLLGD